MGTKFKRKRVTLVAVAVGVILLFIYLTIRYWTPYDYDDTVPVKENLSSGNETINSQKNSTQSSEKLIPKGQSHNGLTPEKAKLLLENCNYSKINDRIDYHVDLLKKLCDAGYSEEAWNLISQGYGVIHESELGSFFVYAHLDESNLINKLSQITFKGDYDTALMGFLQRYKIDQLVNILSSEKMDPFYLSVGNEKKELIGSALSGALLSKTVSLKSADLDDFVLEVSSLVKKGFLDDSYVRTIIPSGSKISPFEKWKILDSIDKNTGSQSLSGSIREKILGSMVSADAYKAMSIATDGNKLEDVKIIVSKWVDMDTNQAQTWYQKNFYKLDLPRRNQVAVAYTSALTAAASTQQELDGAKLWAAQIEDQQMREESLKEIAKITSAFDKAAAPKP
jgi:hypothetical protein